MDARMTEAETVRAIHEQAGSRRLQIYVIATGAGAGIQKWLWEVPGCSTFLVGAEFPYATSKTDKLLTFKPEAGYASDETALDLAMAAYQEAWDNQDTEAIGLGVTASVASTRTHRSDHRVHMACMTKHVTLQRTVVLPKGVGVEARLHDGAEVDRVALRMLKAAVDYQPGVPHDSQSDEVRECTVADDLARARFFLRPAFEHGRRHTIEEVKWFGYRPLLPGAFNPVHAGHEQMADVATVALHLEPVFAICATMPPEHKGTLSVPDMLERAKGLQHRTVVFTEGDPFFIHKARRCPGRPLVIGADAFARLLDPQWGADPAEVLGEMKSLGTTLFVFDRPMDGTVVTVASVLDKAGYSDSPLVAAVVRSAGELTPDISSTMLRGKLRQAKTESASC